MYVGVDIGGTTARASAFSTLESTNELSRIEFRVTKYPNGSFRQDFDKLEQACEQLAAQYGPIEGIGLALAGRVNAARTSLTAAGNLGHWVAQLVVHMLSKRFGCRVALGNDAEAAALAEAYYGCGQECDFWFIIWGSGVGGCLVRYINGVAQPFAGELGHQKVSPDSDKLCGCGQYGCLEAYCGGTGIAKRQRFGVPAKDLTPDQWADVVRWMKIGIRNVVTTQPVPRVVFGGGISEKQSHLLDELERLLKEELRIVEAPDIRLSDFGARAGTIGALALLRLG